MFPFYRTGHRYRETKAAHSSPNEFRDPLGSLWNQARAGPFRPFREYLTQKLIVPGVKEHCLVKVQHMIVWIRGVVVHSKRRNDKFARGLVIQNMLA